MGRTAPATSGETLAAVQDAVREAREPMQATESISEACRLGKVRAIRHLPLTVLTVNEAIRGYYGGMAVYADDPARTEDARVAAQAETDKVLAGLDGPHPESVTVKAVHGFAVEELINAGKDADMMVVGSRGAGGFS